MKIKTKEFLKILSIIRPGLAKNDIMEQGKMFVFTDTDIVTYNDRICISHPFVSDFNCMVNAEDLYKIVAGITDDELSIELENSNFNIVAKRTKAQLKVNFNQKILDLIKTLELDKVVWNKLPEGFINGIYLCTFSTSKSANERILSNIGIKGNCMFSSDNIRASMVNLKEDVIKDFLLPLSSAVELYKFEALEYGMIDSWVHFREKDNIIFSSRIVLEAYPDILSLFDVDEELKIDFPVGIKEVIEFLIPLCEGDMFIDKCITMTINDGTLKCKSQKHSGWVEKILDISYKGDTVEFQINPVLFLDIIDKVKTMIISGDRALFKVDSYQHIMALPLGKGA